MWRAVPWKEIASVFFYLLFAGLLGFAIILAPMPWNSGSIRIMLLAAFYFVAGIPMGYYLRRLSFISLGIGWAEVAVAVSALRTDIWNREIAEILTVALVVALPMLFALAGSFYGAKRRAMEEPT